MGLPLLSRHPTGSSRPSSGLRSRWQSLAPREQRAVVIAGVCLLAAALWLALLGPAWTRLRDGPAQQARLEAQLRQMQADAQTVARLRSRPAANDDADGLTPLARLQQLSQPLGSALTISPEGERLRVRLQGIETAALQRWLAEARRATRVRVSDVQLNRPQADEGRWQGQLVLTLPSGDGAR
jgi:type II secretory pathway component PulM